MAENTLSFLWLIAVLLLPVVLAVRAFVAGGWLVARLEGRGPCPRVEPRVGCRCNHCRGRCLCASRAAAALQAVSRHPQPSSSTAQNSSAWIVS